MESIIDKVIATREEINRFLYIDQPFVGAGSGDSFGYGRGSGDGSGEGGIEGDGYGRGFGEGRGHKLCCGHGHGSNAGLGYEIYTGFAYVFHGMDDGGGIKTINGNIVDHIDDIPTIITQLHGNYARGYIVQCDLTFVPCYIAKVSNSFAHGKTLKDAIVDAEAKAMEKMPIEERIEKFKDVFGTLDSEHTGKEFYDWHYILTGSCRMGRDEFCKSKGIDLTKKYTVRYFLDITQESYRRDIINQVRKSYQIKEE